MRYALFVLVIGLLQVMGSDLTNLEILKTSGAITFAISIIMVIVTFNVPTVKKPTKHRTTNRKATSKRKPPPKKKPQSRKKPTRNSK